MIYPKQDMPIHIKLKNGIKTKGFFYWNGGTPTFAAYGTPLNVNDVIEWEYITKNKLAEGGSLKPPTNNER